MEELLKQIITRLDRMEEGQQQITQRLDRIESTMATKTDITRLENKIEQYGDVQQKDIYHLLKLTNEKVRAIHEDLTTLAEITVNMK